MASVSFRSVSELPTTGEPNVIYLVPKDSTTPTDVKVEYIWVDNHWESIGTTDIDLSTKQDKLYLYTEDTTTHLVEFPLAKVRASTFECGPISLTSANQSNDGNFVCGINAMSPTHYKCGPVSITENGFIADTIKIDENGLRVNYNNPDGEAIILDSNYNSISCVLLSCAFLECFTSFTCGPVSIDGSGFTSGPVNIDNTGFSCGPVLIETYSSTFTCGPLSIEGTRFTCGPVNINTGFSCGPVNLTRDGMCISPITIFSGDRTNIMHQQICEVSVQGSTTFNLSYISVHEYCTAEIWLTYGSTATGAVQFPTNWHWLNTASPSTPPTFQ